MSALLFHALYAAVTCLVIGAAIAITAQSDATPQPLTRAERTGFEETSRYEDVRTFIDELAAKSNDVRIESFGRSEEGRDLPLLVIGDQKPTSPRLPIIFVMANIHAGEVEGKEAVLHLARRLTIGDLRPLARGVIWLLAPIYNADGNERTSLDNRSEQNGPIGGVGTRENARGLDLNRDFIKLESAEARSLVGLMTRWNPDLVIDLHTTNGSHHGYHLTYAPSLNPNADPRLTTFLRQRLFPAVTQALASKHGYRTFYYGNFSTSDALERELEVPVSNGTRAPVWRTFDHRPRFGNNYVGLRNRLGILSEAYSFLDFKGRVRATEAFVEEIGRFVNEHPADVRSLIDQVDRGVARGRSAADAGVAFDLRPLPERVDILVGSVNKKTNPRSGKEMISMVESAATPMRMSHYGVFAASRKRRVPDAYLIPPSEMRVGQAIAKKLFEHGLTVEELTASVSATVERFIVDTVQRSEKPFQGHNEVVVTGRFEQAHVTLPAGTLVVRTRQALGRLAFYLLEPESDDSLATWNYLDAALMPGSTHPILKAVPGQRLPTRSLPMPQTTSRR